MTLPAADSAGTPWAGRSLAATGLEADDGSPDPALAAAVAASDARGRGLAAVVAAVARARLLVPVVAVAGDRVTASGAGPAAEASADMALPHLRAPDGRTALPVFSSVAALAAWDPAARPVPVDARRLALAAVDDGCDVLVLDPAGAAVLVPRPAVWALAQGRVWTPSPQDPEVVAAVVAAAGRAAQEHPALGRARCEAGERAELRVVLPVAPGLGAEALRALTGAVSTALTAEALVAERVDSVELRPVSERGQPALP